MFTKLGIFKEVELKYLCISGLRGLVFIWHVRTDKTVIRYKEHIYSSSNTSLAANYLFCGLRMSGIQVSACHWDASMSMTPGPTYTPHLASLTILQFTPIILPNVLELIRVYSSPSLHNKFFARIERNNHKEHPSPSCCEFICEPSKIPSLVEYLWSSMLSLSHFPFPEVTWRNVTFSVPPCPFLERKRW